MAHRESSRTSVKVTDELMEGPYPVDNQPEDIQKSQRGKTDERFVANVKKSILKNGSSRSSCVWHTNHQRAEAAAKSQNADDKLNEVLQASLHSQKAEVGGVNLGPTNTTVVLLYNATGDTMTYQTKHDWHGHVVGNYPITIHNGQRAWVIFKHVGTDSKGSVGAAYCEMNEPGYYSSWACDWKVIHNKLMNSGTTSEASMKGFTTKVTIFPPVGCGISAKLIAKEGKSATLKLPSGEVRLISKNCSATVGQVGNVGVNQKSLGRAGSKRWLASFQLHRCCPSGQAWHLQIGETLPSPGIQRWRK
ncbi:hypothetical protein E3N88_08201 [Mikania micrantha]|uniref:Large ribosomal subunit protein uL2 C-terminal domain-containing protein n=1 Tax=Mikania micrantha TaxID=192012 RepID=A0A5N6PHT4_9ASTR|nr:hypothetical protein E3N88_08201 [Mikania micrantha]